MPRNTMHPAVQRFRIAIPAATHRRPASCRDVDCTHYLHGWQTVVAVGSAQEHFIRKQSGRRFRVEQTSDTILTFTFESGQRCFGTQHTVQTGRPPFYLHETSAGRRVHTPEGFMEHAHEQIEKNIGLEDRRNG